LSLQSVINAGHEMSVSSWHSVSIRCAWRSDLLKNWKQTYNYVHRVLHIIHIWRVTTISWYYEWIHVERKNVECLFESKRHNTYTHCRRSTYTEKRGVVFRTTISSTAVRTTTKYCRSVGFRTDSVLNDLGYLRFYSYYFWCVCARARWNREKRALAKSTREPRAERICKTTINIDHVENKRYERKQNGLVYSPGLNSPLWFCAWGVYCGSASLRYFVLRFPDDKPTKLEVIERKQVRKQDGTRDTVTRMFSCD